MESLEESNFSDVVENLMNMFGNVMSKDVISAVVESCDGDLNISVDAIMNMANDGNVILKDENKPMSATTGEDVVPIQAAPAIQATSSYASAAQPAQNTGAIPKQVKRPIQNIQNIWTNQIREILYHHGQGNRILTFMRGVPGSGKTYLAKHLIDMTVGPSPLHYKAHILSTDDFFMVRGQYRYEKYKLPEAHMWNQNRCKEATKLGYSPIIIDNTNIEMWEMEPYLREGVKNGYIIQVVEPTTPWARKANQLVRRNTHDVPMATIKRMLDNFQDGITGDSLRHTYGLIYPAGMVPPVKRNVPPTQEVPKESSPAARPDAIDQETTHPTSATAPNDSNIKFFRPSTSTVNVRTQAKRTIDKSEQRKDDENTQSESKETKSDKFFLFLNDDDLTHEEKERQKIFLEAQKKLEEIEKVEIEWENGDSWDKDDQDGAVRENRNSTIASEKPTFTNPFSLVADAKPQRKSPNTVTPVSTSLESAESLMKTVNNCQDWSKISMFMPPWVDSPDPSNSAINFQSEVPVETKSSGTSMEIGDTNVCGKLKVITATPRNINEFYVSFKREKIPEKRMLDKSSMTYEGIIMETFRCSNEEKHFIAFRKLFKNIARSDLRDIFDKCCGDVNWSVEIVLDGMNNNQFKTVNTEELSDQEEEESTEQCACLAKYNIIPEVASSNFASSNAEKTTLKDDKTAVTAGAPSQTQKKKRDATMSNETIQIKRHFEQNVVISDNHYSKHCLKIRKIRRGEPDVDENNFELSDGQGLSPEAPIFEPNLTYTFDGCDEDGYDSEDDIVTVDLGRSFISELDERFGRNNMQYPAYIVPKISLPLSVLSEINALWMESLTYQLDKHAKRTAAMMQQDEEFARQIAMKEEELSLAGKEPEIPDFKEIMDMDMALAIYQKDIAEWKNNMPTDMAAKMTRDKLYNLFPDVDKDTLTELLMAHDNNFNATVEVLLMSTGRDDILEEENGINKFVMAEEMKRKDKILQEQRKELSETEWPLLSEGHEVDMSTVEAYREEADKHLSRRNLNYQKAQDCIRRGMTQVANYYSEIANFHKQKYEHANGLAVASLLQFHALNNPDCTTIDLHYLRVKEAKESLDIFIDTHVSKLRETGNRRKQVLFFITGRGSHSQGRARIKPATIQRLKERGLGYFLKNPGLLAAKVNMDTKLTYQVNPPSG